MSKFTDYFPSSGGSGVGSGIPINGYFPFIVSATGNPTGYDSTTGLYTHPDGTFWLRTGFNIIAATGEYPSATGTPVSKFSYSGFEFDRAAEFTAGGNGMAFDGTNFYLYASNNPSSRVYQYDALGVYTGFSFPTAFEGGTAFASMVPNGNNLLGANGTTVTEFTKAGVATGFSFSLSGNSICVDPSGFIYGSDFSDNIAQYTSAGVATGFSFNYGSEFAGSLDMVFHDGTNIYVGTDGNNIFEYTTAGVYTGNNYDMSTPTVSGASRQWRTGQIFNNEFYAINRGTPRKISNFSLTSGVLIGDLTPRTDTDSTQPLFIRIG